MSRERLAVPVRVRGRGILVCRRASRAVGFLDRLLGLQFRHRWPESHDGLLFPDCAAVHTLFTFLKPDILFLGPGGRVLSVRERVPAWRILSGPRGTRETLEIPGGTARRMHIRPGNRRVD